MSCEAMPALIGQIGDPVAAFWTDRQLFDTRRDAREFIAEFSRRLAMG